MSRLTRRQLLISRTDMRETISTILLMIASASTVLLTYSGVSEGMTESGATFVRKAEAALFALTIGVFSFLGWYFLFGLVDRLRGRFLAIGLVAGFGYISTIAAIDAPFNMMALGGASAVQMSIADMVRGYERETGPVIERTTALRRVIPVMRAEQARFNTLKERELKGSSTGRAGAGRVSSAYEGISLLLGRTVDGLEEGLAASGLLKDKITSELGFLKGILYQQGAMRPRIEAAAKAGDRLDGLLGQLSQYDFAVSLKAAVSILENIVPPSPQAGSAFEKVQNGELASIAAMVRPVAQALRTAMDDLASGPQTSTERPRPLDPAIAIRVYWKPLLPQWVAAGLVSFGPGLLLLILIAARREAESLGDNDGETK